MATSGWLNTSNQYVKYTISISQNSQNISGNTSNVTVSVRFFRTNTGYQTWGSGTVYCKINGTQYTAGVSPDQHITNGGIVLFSKTLNIPHNADGTKRLTCSAWISHNAPLSSSEQSYSQTLTTIPRASSFGTISGHTIGSTMTVNISRASSSFTHKLQYQFGDGKPWVTAATGVGTSCSFTLPLSLCSTIPNSTSGILGLSLQTFNGSTKIGSVYKQVTIYVPSNVVPTMSFTVSDATGYSTKYGGYVQNKSKVKTVITASGAYGSTIKAYSTNVNGQKYTTATSTSSAITTSGSISVICNVTDSRGRVKSETKTITAIAYSNPKLENISVNRCDSTGALNSGGTHLKVSFKSTITSLNNKNSAKYVVKYKKNGTAEYTTVALANYDNVYSVTNGEYIFEADKTSSYDVIFTMSDDFTTLERRLSGATTRKLISILNKGLGLAFGKVAEKANYIEFGMSTIFSNGKFINEKTTDGKILEMVGMNTNNDCFYGYGSRINNVGTTYFDGNTVQVRSNNDMFIQANKNVYIDSANNSVHLSGRGPTYIDGYHVGRYKILWGNAWYMMEGHTATLSQAVSMQPHGIVLVFSAYLDGTYKNYEWNYIFVPKHHVSAHGSTGVSCILLGNSNFNFIGAKYLYVHDTKIVGSANNTFEGTTATGIKINNHRHVMRYVLGV